MTKCWSILRMLTAVVLIVLAVVFGLSSLFTVLLLLNSVNPLQTVTVRSVRVVNESGDHLLITPVGTLGRGHVGPDKMGHKHVLSQFLFEWPALPSIAVKELPLGDGDQRVITYDDEVLHFTDLVLCDSSGKHSRIEVSRYESNRWVLNSSNNLVAVTASTSQLPVDSRTMDAVVSEPRRDWTLIGALAAPPFFLVSATGGLLLLRGRKKVG